MLFKQLFDKESFTYTYLLGCPDTGETILIDPVLESSDRDLEILRQMGLKLTATLETHIHADHITGATRLKMLTGCKIAGAALDELPCRDTQFREGEIFRCGNIEIHPLYTPGHTDTHHAFLLDTPMHKVLFSGDCLLIDSCGRTDFQSGNAGQLYDSIQTRLFTLPNDTLVYPAHDYENKTLTTIGQEKKRNPRLKNNQTREDFIDLMHRLDLPHPKKMDISIPGNLQCGRCPENVPPQLRGLCDTHDQG